MNAEAAKEIERIKEKILPVLHKYGIIHAGLFGSVVRGETAPDSDIDVLVELPENNRFSLLDYAGIQVEIEELLGKKVDLIQYRLIKSALKEIILNEEVRIL